MNKFFKTFFNINNLFFLCIACLGLVFVFFVPPFQKPDEIVHFNRAVTVSYGTLFCKKADDIKIPTEYVQLPDKFAFNRIVFNSNQKYTKNEYMYKSGLVSDSSERLSLVNTNVCGLSFYGYLHSGFSLYLSRLLNLNLSLSFYLGRLVSLAIYICFLFVSLKIINKKYYLFLLVFSSLPMVLHQVTSYGYDALQLSLTLLIFSLVVGFLFDEKISICKYYIFCFLLIFFVLLKPGYYLFILLYFLIPYKKLNLKLKNYLFLSLLFFLITSVGIFFNLNSVIETAENIDRFVFPSIQLKILVTYPEMFLKVVLDTLNLVGDEYIYGLFGVLGWKDYKISLLSVVIFSGLIGYSFRFGKKDLEKNVVQQKKLINYFNLILILSIIIGTLFMIFLSLYVYWTHTTNPYVEGIQGRYFLVLIPLTFLFFNYLYEFKGENFVLFACLIFLFVSNVKAVYLRYFDYSSIVSNLNTYDDLALDENLSFFSIKEDFTKVIQVNPGVRVKGFIFINKPNINVNTVYSYKIMNSDCSKIIREGVLLQDYLKTKKTYVHFFKTIKSNYDSYCVKISPFHTGDEYINIGESSTMHDAYLDLLIL